MEIFGGLAIFVGAFVMITSLPLIATMLVAMFTVHLRYGFSSINTIGLTARRSCLRSSGLRGGFVVYCGLTVLHSGRGGNLLSRFLDHQSKIGTFFSFIENFYKSAPGSASWPSTTGSARQPSLTRSLRRRSCRSTNSRRESARRTAPTPSGAPGGRWRLEERSHSHDDK